MKKTLLLLYMGDETVTAGAGTEKVLMNMANEMTTRGYQVIIATNDHEGAVPYFSLDQRVERIYLGIFGIKMPFWVKVVREINHGFHFIDKPFESWRAGISAKKLRPRLQGRKIDCVIAYNHESIQVADKADLLHVPLAYMLHNSIKIIMGNANQKTLAEKEKADVIQVLMPGFVQEAKKYIQHTPLVWIPNIVRPVPREQQADLAAKKEKYTIITVGRVDPRQKQTHILVQAFSKLAEKYPSWQVKIYGRLRKDKPYYGEVKKMIADAGLSERVLLCGTTPKVQEELQQADIFAFPSAYEGFPLALTEAMAMGLPSVGFRSADAVNELIVDGKNGILCADGADSFADGLEKLMKDQELRIRMGREAVHLMEPYKPKAVWDKWQNLIEDLIQHRPIKGE